MSQGPEFDNKSPWAWSDATIVSLMDELEKLKSMVKKYPNNYELGKKIRQWHNDLTSEEE
jgi:hypothetical protein